MLKDKKTGEDKKVLLLCSWAVFNVAQCENLPESVVNWSQVRELNKDQRDPPRTTTSRIPAWTCAKATAAPSMRPRRTSSSMPAFEAFKDADLFSNTAFHKSTDWTGHKDRCDRQIKNRFGEKDVSFEERVAEPARPSSARNSASTARRSQPNISATG